MKRGTDICGLSLGYETRDLILIPPPFNKNDKEKLCISLPPGSLCILKPPTNNYWMHSIAKDETTTPRISLTYSLHRYKVKKKIHYSKNNML